MSDPARLMGIDHGQKRLGIALSDPLGIIASPLTILQATPKKQALAELVALVEAHDVSKIVVGLPTDSEGNLGVQSQTVLHWAWQLVDAIPVPIVMWDESYSTQDAEEVVRRGRRRRRLDDVSAAVILQSYLEARRIEDEPGQPIQVFFDQTGT